MKFLISLFFLLTVTSCVSFTPNPDGTLKPAMNGVYTLDMVACDNSSFGTGACLIKQGDALKGKLVKIKIPNTNDQSYPSSLEIISNECKLDITVPANPGSVISYDLFDLLGLPTLPQTCILNFVLNPRWENQDKLTVATYPMIGRILLLAVPNAATPVTLNAGLPFTSTGFDRGLQRTTTAMTTFASNFVVNTGGSIAGKVVVQGTADCGSFQQSTMYSAANPTVSIPNFPKSCVVLGTVLRLDKAGSLSFAFAVDVVPSAYQFLQLPGISNGILYLDPTVSAVEVNGQIYFGNHFDIQNEWLKGQYQIRQYTINGRSAWSLINNGSEVWTLQ
jgi:hypothetical protein